MNKTLEAELEDAEMALAHIEFLKRYNPGSKYLTEAALHFHNAVLSLKLRIEQEPNAGGHSTISKHSQEQGTST